LNIFPVVRQDDSFALVVGLWLDEPDVFFEVFLWDFFLSELLLFDLLELLFKVLQLCSFFMRLDSMFQSGKRYMKDVGTASKMCLLNGAPSWL
jgi:hypothetical protein